MEEWRMLDSGQGNAHYNMALDEAIALSVRAGDSPPTLRFYGWENPSVSIGMFQPIRDIDMDYCASGGISVVRRPTGGRAILHGDELTYSVCAPNTGVFSGGLRETYRVISDALSRALRSAGLDIMISRDRSVGRAARARDPLCFHALSFAEISCRGRKLAGSAQRRWLESFLQQGSIPYRIDGRLLTGVFGNRDFEDTGGLRQLIEGFNPSAFALLVKESFAQALSIRLVDGHPSHQELEAAARLSHEKYQSRRWLQKIP